MKVSTKEDWDTTINQVIEFIENISSIDANTEHWDFADHLYYKSEIGHLEQAQKYPT